MTFIGFEAVAAVLSAAAAFVLFWIAIRKGFFVGWKGSTRSTTGPTLLLVLGAFAIYLLGALFIPYLISILLRPQLSIHLIEGATLMNFITGSCLIVAFAFYMKSLYRPIFQSIWGNPDKRTLIKDFSIALIACLISYPLVICIGQLLEIFVYLVFHTFEIPDQSAIFFLKTTFGMPFYFCLAIVSIVLFAPFIEELLFRGFLQSYLRRYLSAPFAIIASSALFACFHYSKEQGLGNIPIIGSLFVLAIFLGFIYERQKSLFAPMIFHAAFNTFSIVNLYFFGN